MNPLKIWRIAKREFVTNFRRRAFLFTLFGLPIFMVLIFAVVGLVLRQSVDAVDNYRRIGIVDEARVLGDPQRGTSVAVNAPFVLVGSRAEAEAALERGESDGYYVIPANYLTTGIAEAFYRPTLAFNDGLHEALTALIKEALTARVGDPALAARLQDPLGDLGARRIGTEQRLPVTALIGVIFVPFVVGILVFILTMTTSQYLMQGLVEEKENRMMEVFMTSTRPTEMLWGKLLGLGALGLTLIGAWAVFYAVLGTLSGSVDVGQIIANLQITPGYLALTLAYALLGYLIIAAIMAAIGATSNTEQESRQISSVIGLLGGAPFVLAFAFFTDPNGGLATFLSIFPFTAATSMLFRAGLTSVPPEQIALSLGLMVVTVAGVVWLAGRIFRLGMLSYGKRPRLGEIWRALREGRREIASTGKAKGTGAEVGA